MKSLRNERAAAVRRLLLFDGALPKERSRRFQEEDEEPCIKESVSSGSGFSVLLWRGGWRHAGPGHSPPEARQAYTPTIVSVYINKQMIIKNEKYRKMAKII